jgi:AraC-like DNA-binding protein
LNIPAKTHQTKNSVPLLGQALGAYWERAARPELRGHFAGVWFHAVRPDAPGRSAIVPDGCADLIWVDGSLRIAGPDRQAKIEYVPPGKTVIGLRLQPGAALAWLGVPASDIVGARASLEDFWGAEAQRLEAWLGEAAAPETIAERLENALLGRLAAIAQPDEVSQAIFRIVGRRRDYSVPVADELGGRFGLSERTLRRRCHDAFGYGPKTLDRILRFQRFLQLVRRPGPGMADLAAEAGYADQSHLTRETRYLAGMTPNSIRGQFLS